MAAATTTTLLKSHSQTILPKRRRFRETTITTTSQPSSDTTTSRKLDTPTIVSPDNSWCCPATAATKLPPPPPPPVPATHIATALSSSSSSSSSPLNRKIRYSTIASHQQMDSYAAAAATVYNTAAHDSYPSSLSKFNNALTAGLLNPMSPPPPSADKTTRSSPTLFEMMANEPDNTHPKPPLQQNGTVPLHPQPHSKPSPLDKQALTQQRLTDLLTCKTPGNQFNDPISSDVKLTLSSKDNLSVQMSVHRQILVAHSRFFSEKLSDKWVKQQRHNGPYIVEIADCDDIEVYIETLKLMYCKDLRKKLMKEDVPKVLGILRVSAAIGFDAGVLSCLEYLEAAPWSEEEEEKVASLLSELQLEGSGSCEVLKRVSLDTQNGSKPENEEILLKLIQVVLEGKDEKARREMKTLVSKMLRENSSNLRKESLYSAIEKSLGLFRTFFNLAANGDLTEVSRITREADNLHWILDILIDKQIAEDFLKIWGSEINLSEVHSKVPAVHRYEISKVTARLFVGIGKGQLMASKDSRCLLIQTWLVPFYDDFAWMRRASKGLDRHLIEEGLSNTILTLPMCWQKEIFMSWFDRFLNCSDDCPNIQRGFEIWWRRAFSGRNCEVNLSRQMRIMNGTIENS